jgi:hypothetical protein
LDATDISTDTVVYKQGVASIKFNIDTTLSGSDRASLTRTFTTGFDFSPYKDIGWLKMWADLPNVTNLSSISLNWGTDASNYYKTTITAQVDGNAFSTTRWNDLGFEWNGATVVGTPTDTNIAYFKIDLDYTGAYVSTDDFRFDFLRLLVPDNMTLTYTTNSVGKSSGGTYLSAFTASTDTFLFGDVDPSLGEVIAIYASVILSPQILVDNVEVKARYRELEKIFRSRFPKRKQNNLIVEPKVIS